MEETQDATQDTVDNVKDTVDQTQDTVDNAQDTTQDTVDNAQDTTQDTVDKAQDTTQDAVDDATDATGGAVDDARRTTEGAVEDAQRAAKRAGGATAAQGTGDTDDPPTEEPNDIPDLVAEGHTIGGTFQVQSEPEPSASRPLDRLAEMMGLPVTGAELLAMVAVGVALVIVGVVFWKRGRRRPAAGTRREATHT